MGQVSALWVDSMSDEEAEYDLVMPFVLTNDNGGPYDPAAFVSGYRLGQLDSALALCQTVPLTEPTELVAPPNEAEQIDLIAMKNGYKSSQREYDSDSDWSVYAFEQMAGSDE